MTTLLQNYHAVVTGGSRGIGYAIAHELLVAGARVTIMGRNEQTLRDATVRLQEQGEVACVSVDVANQQSITDGVKYAVAQFGPVNILVNNAGQASSERFDRITSVDWQRMLDVNLSGTFYGMQAVLPSMLEQQWGRIVNVASTAGLKGHAYIGAYCAAKHGVIGLTRAVALEVARKGITVNAVCPGYTETDIVTDAIAAISKKTGLGQSEAQAELVRHNPQRRLIEPDEVARAVVWLCEPGTRSVNGQAIPVDGGEVMVG